VKFKIERSFEKEFIKLQDKFLSESILSAIENVSSAKNINEIKNLKKLAGHKSAYRIRSGNYRIGIFIENNIVIFAAFDHRRDIYKRFP